MTQTYDNKVQELSRVIAPWVVFDRVEQAEEYATSYKLPESAFVPREIKSMAENFITYASRFGIQKFISPNAAHRTSISMVSEAIRLRAEAYVEECKLIELADLGIIDHTSIKVLA